VNFKDLILDFVILKKNYLVCFLKCCVNMSKMVIRNLQKQLNQVGDKDEQIPNERQEDACNKKAINTFK